MFVNLPLLFLAATPAQITTLPPESSRDSAHPPADSAPSEGLWPSPRLLHVMLLRWAEESCEEYDLDDDQRVKVRETAAKRFETFLTENRSLIQPLANEFIEMRMALEPPSRERVQAWADRALPVFEKTRKEILESNDEFRKVLRPLQRARFEVDALQMRAEMAVAEHKLKEWKSGEFDKAVFWEPLPAERRARREERHRPSETRQPESGPTEAGEPEKAPVDQIVAELDRWEKYVVDFEQMFNLDEGQRTTAFSFLSELKERALAHRDRHHEDIARLEYRIEHNTAGETRLDELKKKLSELYGPIDDMFKELQTRLDKVPTAQQRAAATPKP